MGSILTVRLEPIHKVGEVLRSDAGGQRPEVRIPTDGSLISLGKNAITQIADSGLKRKCVSLQISSGTSGTNQLRVTRAIAQQVSVNGKLVEGNDGVVLLENDILALHAPEIAYEFKVVVDQGTLSKADEVDDTPASVSQDEEDFLGGASNITNNSSSTTTTTNNAAAAAATAQHKSAIADEFCCAYCLEILVHATTIVPCGHSFCRGCLENATECPTCRGAVQTTVHCRSLDNAIATMVAHPEVSVFAADDMEKYTERAEASSSNNCNTSPKKRAAVATRASARKKRKVGTSSTAAGAIRID